MSARFIRSEAHQLRSPRAIIGGVNALAEQLGIGAAEPGNEFRGQSLVEITRYLAVAAGRGDAAVRSAAALYEDSGRDPNYADADELFSRLVERAMIEGFETGPNSYRDWTRQRLVPTFNRLPRKRVLGFDLEAVPEGGAIPVVDAPSEDQDTNNPGTRGCIIRMSRQAFVNGDMRFIDLAKAAGRAAALAVNGDVYAELASNPTLTDGGALFNATAVATPGGHSNLAGVGGAIAAGTLQTGKKAIRSQIGRPGSRPLGLRPRFALVPSAIEDTAWAALGNPCGLGEPGSGGERAMLNAGRLQLIVEPRLDEASATAWYVAADPADEALIEVAFVGRVMQPIVAGTQRNFNNDSRDVCVTFDYAVTPGNWRAGFKNPGV